MLRTDEKTAWTGFLNAAPLFSDEAIANWADGPDPPDVLCMSVSGKTIGVELTKWLEHDQVTVGSGRRIQEDTFPNTIRSENVPRPIHIGRVFLHRNALKLLRQDGPEFVRQLFEFLDRENAKPELPPLNIRPQISEGHWNTIRSWNTPPGAPVNDFAAYPMLKKYLEKAWIHPRNSRQNLPLGMPWILFDARGSAYGPEPMVKAATDNILKKIAKYATDDIRVRHSLGEFDLLCFYCDEAILHNTPIDVLGFGFQQLAAKVKQNLTLAPDIDVFDRIFLFHPYEEIKAVQVY